MLSTSSLTPEGIGVSGTAAGAAEEIARGAITVGETLWLLTTRELTCTLRTSLPVRASERTTLVIRAGATSGLAAHAYPAMSVLIPSVKQNRVKMFRSP